MQKKISDFIERNHLLTAEGIHIIALSGGADSTALLLLMKQLGYHVEAAHCNFKLRGEESDRDEAFARQLCQQHDIPFHLIHFDTRAYATLHHQSIEMAARELRYRYFSQLREDIGAETVCVAHHRDDAVETLLMNLLRGAGIHGLTGIRPKNGFIVRPLLCTSRKEITAYLDSIGQTYVDDSTNSVPDVLRNKLRLQVIPMLESIHPGAAESLMKSATYLTEAEKVYNNAMEWEEKWVSSVEGDRILIDIRKLNEQPSPEALLHEILHRYGFNTTQTSQLLDAIQQGVSGKEMCSSSHVLASTSSKVIIEPHKEAIKPMKWPETGQYRFDKGLVARVEILPKGKPSRQPETATLDADSVRFPLILRAVREGDVFQPFGMKGRKLISDYLTDKKMDILKKRRQLVVEDASGQIVWLVGLRTDERFKVTADTERMLSISILQQE